MKKLFYYSVFVIFSIVLVSCSGQTGNNSNESGVKANNNNTTAQTDTGQPVQSQQDVNTAQNQPTEAAQQQEIQSKSTSEQAVTKTEKQQQAPANNPAVNQQSASKQEPAKQTQTQTPPQKSQQAATSNPQQAQNPQQSIEQSLPQLVDDQGRPLKTTVTRVPEDQRKPFIPKDKQKLSSSDIQLGNAVGNDLGEFFALGIDSTQIKLSDLRGSVVMVILWNSLCDHCVHDLDKYLPIYNDYHGKSYTKGKSFEIFTIGLDKERATWVQALEEKKYPWKHNVYVLDSWKDPDIRFFGVKNLPGSFLIDSDGVVLEKSFTPEQLPELLEKYVQK